MLTDPAKRERNPADWKTQQNLPKTVTALALAYKLHGDPKFLQEAERQMRLLIEQKAFNEEGAKRQRQSLPVSAAIVGLALGYDWLYDDLSPELRGQIENAITSNGFDRLYDPKGKPHPFYDNNWNHVIWGGHAVAALAIGDKHPQRAAQILSDAVPLVTPATTKWQPSGVSPEGTHYWDFGAQFYVLMLDAMETALGTDYGLTKWSELDESAAWRIAARGPQGDFPFGDGDRTNRSVLPLSWLAAKNGQNWLVRSDDLRHLATNEWQVNAESKNWLAMPLIWAPANLVDGTPPASLLTFRGEGEGISNVLFRSSWQDDALWLAVRGGRADVSHGHMDIGSFVLDWNGVRWADEVGTRHYFNKEFEAAKINLWEWGNKGDRRGRENVYAWGSKGHNTLMIEGRFHDPKGVGAITAFDAAKRSATLDLTPVLGDAVRNASRTFQVPNGAAVVIEDRWTGGAGAFTMLSRLHTRAQVEVMGRTATLTQDGKTLKMEVMAPADARLVARPIAEVLEVWDAPQPGVTVVDVQVDTAPGQERALTVRLTPQ